MDFYPIVGPAIAICGSGKGSVCSSPSMSLSSAARLTWYLSASDYASLMSGSAKAISCFHLVITCHLYYLVPFTIMSNLHVPTLTYMDMFSFMIWHSFYSLVDSAHVAYRQTLPTLFQPRFFNVEIILAVGLLSLVWFWLNMKEFVESLVLTSEVAFAILTSKCYNLNSYFLSVIVVVNLNYLLVISTHVV